MDAYSRSYLAVKDYTATHHRFTPLKLFILCKEVLKAENDVQGGFKG